MINSQTIVDRCLFLLDAEGSDRYLWDRDFQYAIAAAVDNTVSIMNAAYSQKKLSEEALRDLTYMRIFQASTYSRIATDATALGHYVWTIFAVHPKPVLIPSAYSLPAATEESVYLSDASFRSSMYSAKRLTPEQWSLKDRNPLMPGSSLATCAALIDYAYINYTNYQGGYTLQNNGFEIEVAPAVPGEAVAIRYAAYPTPPTNATDDIQLPNELTNMVTNLTMKFIGIKQGELPQFSIADKEIKELTSQMR